MPKMIHMSSAQVDPSGGLSDCEGQATELAREKQRSPERVAAKKAARFRVRAESYNEKIKKNIEKKKPKIRLDTPVGPKTTGERISG